MLASIHRMLVHLGQWLLAPLEYTHWTDWRMFWLGEVARDRMMVLLFLPLIPVLLLLPQRHLRLGIVLTGLVFVFYAFGLP